MQIILHTWPHSNANRSRDKKTITFREDSITFVFEQATLKYDIDNEVTTEETERGISWQNDAKR